MKCPQKKFELNRKKKDTELGYKYTHLGKLRACKNTQVSLMYSLAVLLQLQVGYASQIKFKLFKYLGFDNTAQKGIEMIYYELRSALIHSRRESVFSLFKLEHLVMDFFAVTVHLSISESP